MYIETQEEKVYHSNGQLSYECTFAVVEDNNPKFPPIAKIYHDNGEIKIRIGVARKFWDNGQLNWMLKYNDDGTLVNEKFTQYRADGTAIVY